jgi:lipid A ethanolaminephosphotransferase
MQQYSTPTRQPLAALSPQPRQYWLPPLPTLSVNSLLLLFAAWIATTQNRLLWSEVMKSLPGPLGLQSWGILVAVTLVLFSAVVLTGALFSHRRMLRAALILLLFVAAGSSYFMDRFHVVIDQTMIVNSVQTDRREAAELIGLPLVLHLLAYALLPALFIARVPLRRAGLLRETAGRIGLVALLLSLTATSVFAQYRSVSSWARNNADMRMYPNPSYPIYSAIKYARSHWGGDRHKAPMIVGTDARRGVHAGRRPQVIVLVIGETARAANFQLHGYARATNPQLSAMKDLIYFRDVRSCGTSTAISVPCMFFDGGHRDFSKEAAAARENLLDLVQRAGVPVLWRNNNSGCKEVCNRVPTEDLSSAADAQLCGPDGCFDEILLRGLSEKIAGDGDQLIVLHSKGSHGPSYYKRVPDEFRRFQPACSNDDLQQCTPQEIVNAYDNTILYTDHFLAGLIGLLKARQDDVDSAVIYLSDHGESLGESGLYLHGMPYGLAPDTQTQVPMMAWFSPGALRAQGMAQDCVQRLRAEPLSHDNLYSSVLGLLDIQTSLYRPELDIFQACRAVTPSGIGQG